MTTLSQYKKGDFLFRQGDASDRVLRVRSGEIEILREVGATSVLLGHVRDGEWLGEMGVIEGRSRSATARAATDGEVEVLSARQFLERVSSDPALAHDLILRLSVRLRRIEDKIAGNLLPFVHDRSPDGAGERRRTRSSPTMPRFCSPLRAMRCARGSARRPFMSPNCHSWLAGSPSRMMPNLCDAPIS